MGQIQNAINSMLSTGAQVATMTKALDILAGPKAAEKALPAAEQEASKALEEANKAEEQAFTQEEALKENFMEEKGLKTEEEFQEASAFEYSTEWQEDYQPLIDAGHSMAKSLADKYTQKEAFKQRLEDIKNGKNKASRTNVRKMVKKEGKKNG